MPQVSEAKENSEGTTRYHVTSPFDGWASAKVFCLPPAGVIASSGGGSGSGAGATDGMDLPPKEKSPPMKVTGDYATGISEGPLLVKYSSSGTCTLTMNKKETNNQLDSELVSALRAAIDTLKEKGGEVRVVLFRSSSSIFCAGGSLDETAVDAKGGGMDQLFFDINRLPQVTVALVNGHVFGGGNGIIACCDTVCALKAATFTLPEVKLGIVPAAVAPWVVKCIGARQARRYLLTAETISASTAATIGLIHEVTDDLEKFVKDFLKVGRLGIDTG